MPKPLLACRFDLKWVKYVEYLPLGDLLVDL